MIPPHGGRLVDQVVAKEDAPAAREEAASLPKLIVSRDAATDVRNIAHGVYSPLEGFVTSGDFDSIIEDDRLAGGAAWAIPIIKESKKESLPA